MPMRHASIALVGGLLLLALPGCEASWGPSYNLSSRPGAPGDSLTIRRVMGDIASAEPVEDDTALGWIGPEAPRTTLGSAEEAMRGAPDFRPVPRARLENEGRPATRQGSAAPPPEPTITEQRVPGPEPVNVFEPSPDFNPPPEPSSAGRVIPIPGGPPAVLGTPSGGHTPYTRAGLPGGIAVDNGTGGITLLGSDGSIRVVPR